MDRGAANNEPQGGVQIRIRPDGRIYFEGLTAEALEVAAALGPGEPSVQRRLALLPGLKTRPRPAQGNPERQDGDSETGR
jgi:hypothetical protein